MHTPHSAVRLFHAWRESGHTAGFHRQSRCRDGGTSSGNDSIPPTEVTAEDYHYGLDGKIPFNPSPTRAVWLSALCPGLGQIYNRRYWKLPIVIGGFMGLGYATAWNSNQYQDYMQAYRDLLDNDPGTNSYMDFFPPTTDESTLRQELARTVVQVSQGQFPPLPRPVRHPSRRLLSGVHGRRIRRRIAGAFRYFPESVDGSLPHHDSARRGRFTCRPGTELGNKFLTNSPKIRQYHDTTTYSDSTPAPGPGSPGSKCRQRKKRARHKD